MSTYPIYLTKFLRKMMDNESSKVSYNLKEKQPSSKKLLPFHGKNHIRISLYTLIVLFLGNLNALVDAVMHPEIEYFDHEHLIVGGVVMVVTAVLFGIVSAYLLRLEKTIETLNTLKGLLPICSNCKKIRDPENAWHALEQYLSERSDILFTHSICPECYKELYGDIQKKLF